MALKVFFCQWEYIFLTPTVNTEFHYFNTVYFKKKTDNEWVLSLITKWPISFQGILFRVVAPCSVVVFCPYFSEMRLIIAQHLFFGL
jgi:hypothetical protein